MFLWNEVFLSRRPEHVHVLLTARADMNTSPFGVWKRTQCEWRSVCVRMTSRKKIHWNFLLGWFWVWDSSPCATSPPPIGVGQALPKLNFVHDPPFLPLFLESSGSWPPKYQSIQNKRPQFLWEFYWRFSWIITKKMLKTWHLAELMFQYGAKPPIGVRVNKLGGGLNYFLFSPRKLGKIPILTHIFQRGWFNHQLDKRLGCHYDQPPWRSLVSLGAPVTSIQSPRCSLFWCRRERFHWDGPSLLGMEVGRGTGWKELQLKQSHVFRWSVSGTLFFGGAKSALGRGSLDGSLLVNDNLKWHKCSFTIQPAALNESPKIWGPSVCESPLSPKVFLSGTGLPGGWLNSFPWPTALAVLGDLFAWKPGSTIWISIKKNI